jgi:hypothetical protein
MTEGRETVLLFSVPSLSSCLKIQLGGSAALVARNVAAP